MSPLRDHLLGNCDQPCSSKRPDRAGPDCQLPAPKYVAKVVALAAPHVGSSRYMRAVDTVLTTLEAQGFDGADARAAALSLRAAIFCLLLWILHINENGTAVQLYLMLNLVLVPLLVGSLEI